MDYSQICQGWIYSIINKVNGKIYIGQTNNFYRRKKEHFYKKNSKCSHLKNAMHVYGNNNFEMKSLVHFTAIDKEVCRDILNKLERYYIAKFKSNQEDFGYNLTSGGDGRCNYITSKETKQKIGAASSQRHPTETTKERIKNALITFYKTHDSHRKGKGTPILQYDLTGRFIRRFQNSVEAALACTGKKKSCCTIREAVRDFKCAYNSFWVEETNTIQLFIDIPSDFDKHTCIYHYSKFEELLGYYKSVSEASILTGSKESYIRNSLKNQNRSKSRRTNGIIERGRRVDYWSWEKLVS